MFDEIHRTGVRAIADQHITVRRERGHLEEIEHAAVGTTTRNDIARMNLQTSFSHTQNQIASAGKWFGYGAYANQQCLMGEQWFQGDWWTVEKVETTD